MTFTYSSSKLFSIHAGISIDKSYKFTKFIIYTLTHTCYHNIIYTLIYTLTYTLTYSKPRKFKHKMISIFLPNRIRQSIVLTVLDHTLCATTKHLNKITYKTHTRNVLIP